tara:strand:- start:488 stop:1255 length:768 start_codon:yes stop_codon:yes gene_type:complete
MKYIKLELIDSIAIIKISNPKQLNALNEEVLKDLEQSLIEIEQKNEIKVVIITGEGEKAFVAGADIKLMSSMSKEMASKFSRRGQQIFSKIENFKKPVIAAINGYALGGGSELALSCHIRYASSKAKIGQPEVKLGIIAGWGGTQRLPKIVSKGKAIEILTSGKIYSAEECFKIGLVDDIFEPNKLMDKSLERAIEISQNSPKAISKTLEMINLSYDLKTKEGFSIESIEFGKLFQEEESIEGISAFLENRKAKF